LLSLLLKIGLYGIFAMLIWYLLLCKGVSTKYKLFFLGIMVVGVVLKIIHIIFPFVSMAILGSSIAFASLLGYGLKAERMEFDKVKFRKLPILFAIFLIFLGNQMNVTVMVMNGGKMPVFSRIPAFIERSRESSSHFWVDNPEKISFPFLADWIEIDGKIIISPGDLLMSLAVWFFFIYLCVKIYLTKIRQVIPRRSPFFYFFKSADSKISYSAPVLFRWLSITSIEFTLKLKLISLLILGLSSGSICLNSHFLILAKVI